MNPNQPRTIDGRFSFVHHQASSGVHLDTLDEDFAPIGPLTTSPWGEVQWQYEGTPGIAIVETDSHGGIKLSDERNAMVPRAVRKRSGWYEEDCEVYAVSYTFPDADYDTPDYPADRRFADAEEGLKRWYPQQYKRLKQA